MEYDRAEVPPTEGMFTAIVARVLSKPIACYVI
jgi:hypothetical protein